MCPFEAVVSHIEMYCELLRCDHKKGGFSCAIKCVSSYITECLGQCRSLQQNQIEQVILRENFFQPMCCHDMRKLKSDETSILEKNIGFAAENINNVTWSYAILYY